MDYSSYTSNPYYPMPAQQQVQRSGSAGSNAAKGAGAVLATGATIIGGVAAIKNPKKAGKLVTDGFEHVSKVAKSPFKAIGKAFDGTKALAKKGWEGLTGLFKKVPSDEALRKAQPEGPRRIEITSPNEGPHNIPITDGDAIASKPVVPTTIKPKQIEIIDGDDVVAPEAPKAGTPKAPEYIAPGLLNPYAGK
jgi:hypothetical protein